MKYINKKNKKKFDIHSITFSDVIFVLYLAFCAFSLVVLIYGACAKNDAVSTAFNGGISNSFSDSWHSDSLGKSVNLNYLNTIENLLPREPYRVSAQLPSFSEDIALVFKSSNTSVRVFAGGELICDYSYKLDSFYGAAAFSAWNYVPISDKYSGEKLTLELTTGYDDSSCCLNSIMLGEGYVIVRNLMCGDIPTVVIASVCFVAGLCFMLLSIITKKIIGKNLGTVFFGFFCVFIALWFMCGTVWISVAIKNVGFVQMMANILIILSVIPVIMYISCAYEMEHKTTLNIVIIVSIFATIISMVYHFAGIADFHQTKFIYHLIIAIAAIFTIVSTVSYLVKSRGSGEVSVVYYVGLIFFVICVIIDLSAYYLCHSVEPSYFTKYGMLVLMVSVGASTINKVSELLSMGARAITINKVAYTDALTGIENTAAFKRRMNYLEERRDSFEYISIIQFDVNNLKTINDGMGHEAGDALIISAAEIIKQAFGSYGNCYRVGGDEFVAIMTVNHAPVVYDEAAQRFEELMNEFNENEDRPFDLRIAYGVAFYQQGQGDILLSDVHKLADERMYKKKVAMKKMYAKTPEEAIVR